MTNDAEEVLLQKLLQSILEKVFASFPVEDPAFHPVPPHDGLDAEDSFSSFPSLPGKYAAHANQQRHADAHNNCTKNASTHPSLLPGSHCKSPLAIYLVAGRFFGWLVFFSFSFL